MTQHKDVPPVIATPHHFLFIFYHNNLYFIAVTISESLFFIIKINFFFFNLAPPLMIFEILSRIVQTFADYFGECSDSTIKENIVIVFEVII